MSNIYNVLWIDDQHEELSALHRTAIDFGIKLFPYKSMNGGCGELEKNFNLYDAVLLDAKFFENEEDTPGTEDTQWVHRAKERILQLPKRFEYFVLTGQAKTYASEEFNKAFPYVYEKGKSEDEDELFDRLVEASKKQGDTQIRHKYPRVFNACNERYLGDVAGQDLLTILKEKDSIDANGHFNSVRKIVEDLFIAFNKYQLLPIDFVSPTVALNPSSKFLAGIEQSDARFSKYTHKTETHLPKQIALYIKQILSVVQPEAHRSSIDTYIRVQNTPYLFNSVLYQLLDVITWFKDYIDSNPTTENWTVNEESESATETTVENDLIVEGAVINYSISKGFAFLQPSNGGENIFIPPHLVTDNNLEEGMTIRGEKEDYIDNRTEEARTRIKKIVN